MAKSSKPRAKPKHETGDPKPGQARKSKMTRRAAIGNVALYGAGALALVGGGTAFAFDFRRKLAEADLSRIGDGMASVVQIHDPGCPSCRALQKETRAALRSCDEGGTQYLVADINSTDGASFASGLGLPHVTLALFDGEGRHVHTIQGVTPAADIKAAIQHYLG